MKDKSEKKNIYIYASVTIADSLSTAHVKASLAPGGRSRRSSLCVVPKTRIHFPCFSAAESCQGPFCPPRLGLARARFVAATTAAPTVCGRDVATLSRLGRGLAVEFAAVASAATPELTADSESSAQCAAQRVVLDPLLRSLSLKVTAVPSDSSLWLTS